MPDGTVTLHIPADMREEIIVCTPLDTTELLPLFASGYGENPDEFSVAIYTDYKSDSVEVNMRASLIVEVLDKKDPGAEIEGDCYLVCPDDLAVRFLDNDQQFQAQIKFDKAIRSWIKEYATNNSEDPAEVFNRLVKFVTCVVEKSTEAMERDMAATLAKRFDLDPEQVGVIVL